MKLDDRIYELISNKLNGELNPGEEQEFEAWLSEDEKHAEVFDEMRRLQHQVKLLRRRFEPDVENSLAGLKRLRGRRLVIGAWKYAAMFVLPLGIALALWVGLGNDGEELTHREFSSVAMPGAERAVLRLFDGNTVLLDSMRANVLIAGTTDVQVLVDSNRLLRYSMNDTTVGAREMRDNELIVPRGGEYQIVLADGTRVWLNSNSKLIFPPYFTGAERRVVLSGEAFFDVARDEAKPFIVETSRMDVKVLGTRFNVNAYADNDVSYTTLVNGCVEIVSNGQEPIVLKPGEQAYGNADELEKREVNVRMFTSWMDGKFMFNNTELEEIAKQISRWYDVDIIFSNESVKKIRFTGAMVKFKPLGDLIRMLEKTSQVRFSVKGKNIVISEE